ncbi:MAG: FAD-dependent oxidoreductase [Rhodospirillaceae bacterium]|nr:FAD-dependent oxidoreductase [Rhodospirillaceae bacterium]
MAARTVAVIGAGIVGTVAACFLRREGHEVTLYDRDAPGCGASFGNSGVISPAAVMPVAMPGLLKKVPRWLLDETGPLYLDWRELPRLMPWLIAFLRAGREDRVRAISAALAALNGPTLDLLMPLLREAGLDALVQRKGMLYVDPIGQEGVRESLAVSLQRAAGYRVEELDAAGLRDLEPALAPGFASGVHVPAAAHTVDPYRLVTGLAEHFEREGGSFTRARVDRIASRTRDRAAVDAGGEIRDFDAVVVAAGVWSRPLVAGLGYRVPLVAQRGYHVTFTNPGVVLNRVVLPVALPATIVPMAMGIRIGGTVEFARKNRPANERRVDALCRHAKTTLPALRIDERTTWMGERPCTPDSVPVLGRAPRHPAVLFAFGHGHQGVIGAAKTAEVIADLVAERTPSLDLAPFGVDRFSLLERVRS